MAVPFFDDDNTYFIFTESLLNTFLGGSDSKEFACNARDSGSIPVSGRSSGEESLSTPVFLPVDSYGQRSLGATVHRVEESQTLLVGLTLLNTNHSF